MGAGLVAKGRRGRLGFLNLLARRLCLGPLGVNRLGRLGKRPVPGGSEAHLIRAETEGKPRGLEQASINLLLSLSACAFVVMMGTGGAGAPEPLSVTRGARELARIARREVVRVDGANGGVARGEGAWLGVSGGWGGNGGRVGKRAVCLS